MRVTTNFRHCIVVIVLLLSTSLASGQVFGKYNGMLGGGLLYETITLNSDSTFQWTSEYDLAFSDYGKYKIHDKILILEYYLSHKPTNTSVDDTLSGTSKVFKMEYYLLEDDKLFRASNGGKKIATVKDKSIRRSGSLFCRFRHQLTFLKE